MSEVPTTQKTPAEGLAPAGNAALSEAAWQNWVSRNKERDAAHRGRLIRVLWLVSPLGFVCVVIWWLAVSK